MNIYYEMFSVNLNVYHIYKPDHLCLCRCWWRHAWDISAGAFILLVPRRSHLDTLRCLT